MPTEIRHILFRATEVVVAVAEYSRRIRQPLPPGSVVKWSMQADEEGGSVRFTLTIDDESGDSRRDGGVVRHDVTIEGPALAAALILYCRDRRIPLPSGAEKALQRFGDLLALVVTRNPRQEPMPRFTPL